MARTARAVAIDTPHHVTQRGNGRQDVFCSDRDRHVYLDTLFDYAARYRLRVWGVLPDEQSRSLRGRA